jgi:hypothetical protein
MLPLVLPSSFRIFKKLKILAIFLLCLINSVTFIAGLLATKRVESTLNIDRRFCFLEVLISATKSNICSTGDLVVSE